MLIYLARKELYFMKTLICIFISLLMLFIVSKRESINNTTEKGYLPDQIVKQFIDFSIEGNENGISSLIITQPDSYLHFCEETNDIHSKQNSNLPIIKPTEEINYENTISNKLEKNTYDNYKSLFSSITINSSAVLEAEYIYASHSAFSDINILNTKIYQDEAIVDVEYIIVGKTKREKKFLLKNINGWKIFDTISTTTSKSVINENYASPRPLCKKD